MISKNQIKLVRSLEHKKHRMAEGLFVAEGPKVVGDLLACHFRPRLIFSLTPDPSPKSLTPDPSPKERGVYTNTDGGNKNGDVIFVTVTEDELRRLSFLQHPQQVLAVMELPNGKDYSLTSHPLPPTSPLTLVLDGVQDPGNLGTIIRIADWYGIDTIYCSPETADAWNPKVVQATMGSIARVRMVYTPLEPLLRNARVPVYGTVLDGENIYRQQLSASGMIVMGNEGNGISQSVRQLLTHRLLIPAARPGAESLNVAIATAIVCSEFRRAELRL